MLPPFSFVRVIKLLHEPEHYNGFKLNQRAPQVGDTGTVVEVLQTPDIPEMYVVESVNESGEIIWLSDFSAEELEAI